MGTLWFEQLGQIELTRLERDMQSISWTSSFLIGGLFEVLYDMLSCMVFYNIINIYKGKIYKEGSRHSSKT